MANYKISGNSSDNNRAYVIKNGIYIGYKDTTVGAYDLVFDSTDANDVMAVAEKSDGETTGFGGITAIATGDSPNLILPSSGMTVASIQVGTMATNSFATINSVDMSKSILFPNGATTPSTLPTMTYYMELASSTTVFCKTTKAGGTAAFTVVEFASGINSIQRGIINPNWAPLPYDVTISAVDVSKSFVNFCGIYANQGQSRAETATLVLLNSTTLRIDLDTTGTELELSYEVIELE